MNVNEYKIKPHIVDVRVYLCWGMGSGMYVILKLGSYASAREGVDGSAQYLFLGIHSSGQRPPMLYLESAGVTLPVWLL